MRYFSLALVLLWAVAAPASAQTPPAPLAAFSAAWSAIKGYHTSAHVYQVQGTNTQNSTYDYTFTKPASVAMNIVSGPNTGTSISYGGGDTVRAGKGMFTKNFSLTDPMVTSIRGMTIVGLSFGAILQHAEQTPGTLSAATTTLDGATVNAVNLAVATPAGDNGLTREVIYLSPATNLPLRVDGYTGDKLVQTVTFSGTTTN